MSGRAGGAWEGQSPAGARGAWAGPESSGGPGRLGWEAQGPVPCPATRGAYLSLHSPSLPFCLPFSLSLLLSFSFSLSLSLLFVSQAACVCRRPPSPPRDVVPTAPPHRGAAAAPAQAHWLMSLGKAKLFSFSSWWGVGVHVLPLELLLASGSPRREVFPRRRGGGRNEGLWCPREACASSTQCRHLRGPQ